VAVIYEVSAYRTLSYLAHRDRPAFARFTDRSAAGLFLAGVPFAVGGAVVGDRVLTLVFGHAFAGAGGVFRILLWSLPVAFPAILLMAAIVADERPQDAGWIFAVAFVTNVVANVALVPTFGIEAAGWTSLGTAVVLVAGASVVLSRRGLPAGWPLLAIPAVPAGALMALAIYPLRSAPLGIPIAAGGAVYLFVLLVLRVPTRLGVPSRRAGSSPTLDGD
jgi:O-antigen/teichoic acid export membrane protein